jgi:hypothetical protein
MLDLMMIPIAPSLAAAVAGIMGVNFDRTLTPQPRWLMPVGMGFRMAANPHASVPCHAGDVFKVPGAALQADGGAVRSIA